MKSVFSNLSRIVKEELSKQHVFIECEENRCVHNKNGNCNKTNSIVVTINKQHECTSFDFE
jgi:hypothetical protein